MDCPEVREHLTDYVYGEAAPEVREAVAAHLAACPDCRRAAEEAEAVLAAYREAPRPAPPEGAPARAAQAARPRRPAGRVRRRVRVLQPDWLRVVRHPAFAAAALFVVVFLMVVHAWRAPEEEVGLAPRGYRADRTDADGRVAESPQRRSTPAREERAAPPPAATSEPASPEVDRLLARAKSMQTRGAVSRAEVEQGASGLAEARAPETEEQAEDGARGALLAEARAQREPIPEAPGLEADRAAEVEETMFEVSALEQDRVAEVDEAMPQAHELERDRAAEAGEAGPRAAAEPVDRARAEPPEAELQFGRYALELPKEREEALAAPPTKEAPDASATTEALERKATGTLEPAPPGPGVPGPEPAVGNEVAGAPSPPARKPASGPGGTVDHGLAAADAPEEPRPAPAELTPPVPIEPAPEAPAAAPERADGGGRLLADLGLTEGPEFGETPMRSRPRVETATGPPGEGTGGVRGRPVPQPELAARLVQRGEDVLAGLAVEGPPAVEEALPSDGGAFDGADAAEREGIAGMRRARAPELLAREAGAEAARADMARTGPGEEAAAPRALTRALAEYRAGDYARALRSAQEVPEDVGAFAAAALEIRVLALWALGDEARAREALLTLRERDPDLADRVAKRLGTDVTGADAAREESAPTESP